MKRKVFVALTAMLIVSLACGFDYSFGSPAITPTPITIIVTATSVPVTATQIPPTATATQIPPTATATNTAEPVAFCKNDGDTGPLVIGSQVILGRNEVINGTDDWLPEMDAYVGSPAVITDFAIDKEGCTVAKVDVDGGKFYWRIRNMKVLVQAPTATPVPPMVTASQDMNCRSAPGPKSDTIVVFSGGESGLILGKNFGKYGVWYYIQLDRTKCWVAGTKVSVSGDLSKIPNVVP